MFEAYFSLNVLEYLMNRYQALKNQQKQISLKSKYNICKTADEENTKNSLN